MNRRYGVGLAVGVAGVLLAGSFAVIRPRLTHREQSVQPAGPSAIEETGEKWPIPQSNPTSPKQKTRRVERPLRNHPAVMRRVTEEAKERPADRAPEMGNRVSAPDSQVGGIRKGSSAPPQTGPRSDEQTIVAPPPTDAAAPSVHAAPVLTPPVLLGAPSHADALGAYEVVLERGELAPQLRVRSLEGRVVLRVFVLADGSVARAEIERSSGQTTLDQAAVTSARSWRFDPARRDGTPIDAWALIPVRFVLR